MSINSTTQQYQIADHGDASQLLLKEVPLPAPAPQEVQIRQQRIGINFIDIYHREGLYPLELPAVLGYEAMGIITKVGAGVSDYQVGQCVGYAFGAIGAYQTLRNVSADVVFPIEDGIADKVSGSLLRGLTAEYLVNRIGSDLGSGDSVLLYAAAGGVGLIALQWLLHLRVNVIAVVGSQEKADIVRAYGCEHIINHRTENIVEAVSDITQGRGVKIAYDSVGKDTFGVSLDCLSRRGLMVSYGNASGAVDAFTPALLAQKGGLFITRPSLAHYYGNKQEILEHVPFYFDLVKSGVIKNDHTTCFDFVNLPKAHLHLESGQSIGTTQVVCDSE